MEHIDARDRVEKYTLMRVLANEIQAIQADALIEIAEVWMGPFSEANKGPLPADAPDRKEGLVVVVATREGKYRQYLTLFTRTLLGKISLGETQIFGTIPYYLSPVFQVWGLPIPKVPDKGDG